MASTNIYTSPVGLSVFKPDWSDDYTITGYPSKKFCIRDFDSAYDFEAFVQEKVNSKHIAFDSESCQFFAYAKTKARAVAYVKAIEKYFEKVSSLLSTDR